MEQLWGNNKKDPGKRDRGIFKFKKKEKCCKMKRNRDVRVT